MILHGIDATNIIHTNTLTENLADIQEKDRVDVVMANPPFGGKERKEAVQTASGHNFGHSIAQAECMVLQAVIGT